MENLVETRKGMMVEKLETRSAPALAAINAFVRGSSARLCSSNKLGWDGVYLEHHRMFPGERNDTVSTHHLVVLCTSHVARGETSWEHAHFVPYSYSPGDMKLYSAGLIGAARRFTDATAISCALDPKLVSEVGDDLGVPSTVEFRPIANLRDDSLQGVVKLLAAEANSQGASGKLYADHLAHALALRFRQLSGGVRGPKPSQSGKMPTRILERVLDRMRADLATNLDLNTIAAESGYSRTHFLRTFRASTGYSPHQWLTHLRIEEAKTLLQKASNSLIDIALDCGFSSHGHFSNTFRRIVGVTPREYRRNYGLIL
jgi:AraC family transcriptional regulator